MSDEQEYEGEQIGKSFGYWEDEEATLIPMTPELYAQWHNIRQATPALAYCLMGMFDNDDLYMADPDWATETETDEL